MTAHQIKKRRLQLVGQKPTSADMETRITVRVPRDWHAKLAAAAKAENLKVSDLVRRAIVRLLESLKRAA